MTRSFPLRTSGTLLLLSGWLTTLSGETLVQAQVPTTNPTQPSATVPAFSPEDEALTMGFVREHHPELAKVLEVLKPMNPEEFRKAITELRQVSRTLGDLKTRNPKRYEVALDAWKAKSRVELLAAQISGSPSEELQSQLRTAIEARIDAEVRRQRFDLEQAEAAAKRAREALDRLETNRQAIVDARFRALTPKKPAKAKKLPAKPALAPLTTPPSTQPAKPNGEDRR